eukprot:39876-Eustigmatos_ZCMA.PRE.1
MRRRLPPKLTCGPSTHMQLAHIPAPIMQPGDNITLIYGMYNYNPLTGPPSVYSCSDTYRSTRLIS